ncbi:MAG: uroporphyrinogen decarboxylase family protein [Prolixibacteraceae bacterium]|nr:uroporphyrinogen decarboxylase family protein [Prolixibacteraceae bacterium]
MNGKQRIEAALKGEWPDKRPVLLHNFLMAAREYGVTMKQYREDPEVIAKTHIYSIEKYDLDGALIDIDTATLAGAVGVPVDFPDDSPARVHVPALKSLKMVEDLVPAAISKNERIQIWLEACRIIKNHFGNEKFIRGNCDQAPFSLASMMRSSVEWMMDLLMEDELVFKLLDFCTDASSQFIRLMVDTGVDMISNGDSPAGPDMISPEMYEIFALPYEKIIVKEAHRLGKPYMLHICGNTDIILDKMLKTGTDALELDYKTNIDLVQEMCNKSKVTFSGNIDPSGVLAFGNTSLVEEKTIEVLKLFKNNPRLIMNAGCAIPKETPSENIKKLIEVTRNHG